MTASVPEFTIPGTDAIWALSEAIGVNSGTFRLQYSESTYQTAALNWDVSQVDIQAAVRDLHPDLNIEDFEAVVELTEETEDTPRVYKITVPHKRLRAGGFAITEDYTAGITASETQPGIDDFHSDAFESVNFNKKKNLAVCPKRFDTVAYPDGGGWLTSPFESARYDSAPYAVDGNCRCLQTNVTGADWLMGWIVGGVPDTEEPTIGEMHHLRLLPRRLPPFVTIDPDTHDLAVDGTPAICFYYNQDTSGGELSPNPVLGMILDQTEAYPTGVNPNGNILQLKNGWDCATVDMDPEVHSEVEYAELTSWWKEDFVDNAGNIFSSGVYQSGVFKADDAGLWAGGISQCIYPGGAAPRLIGLIWHSSDWSIDGARVALLPESLLDPISIPDLFTTDEGFGSDWPTETPLHSTDPLDWNIATGGLHGLQAVIRALHDDLSSATVSLDEEVTPLDDVTAVTITGVTEGTFSIAYDQDGYGSYAATGLLSVTISAEDFQAAIRGLCDALSTATVSLTGTVYTITIPGKAAYQFILWSSSNYDAVVVNETQHGRDGVGRTYTITVSKVPTDLIINNDTTNGGLEISYDHGDGTETQTIVETVGVNSGTFILTYSEPIIFLVIDPQPVYWTPKENRAKTVIPEITIEGDTYGGFEIVSNVIVRSGSAYKYLPYSEYKEFYQAPYLAQWCNGDPAYFTGIDNYSYQGTPSVIVFDGKIDFINVPDGMLHIYMGLSFFDTSTTGPTFHLGTSNLFCSVPVLSRVRDDGNDELYFRDYDCNGFWRMNSSPSETKNLAPWTFNSLDVCEWREPNTPWGDEPDTKYVAVIVVRGRFLNTPLALDIEGATFEPISIEVDSSTWLHFAYVNRSGLLHSPWTSYTATVGGDQECDRCETFCALAFRGITSACVEITISGVVGSDYEQRRRDEEYCHMFDPPLESGSAPVSYAGYSCRNAGPIRLALGAGTGEFGCTWFRSYEKVNVFDLTPSPIPIMEIWNTGFGQPFRGAVFGMANDYSSSDAKKVVTWTKATFENGTAVLAEGEGAHFANGDFAYVLWNDKIHQNMVVAVSGDTLTLTGGDGYPLPDSDTQVWVVNYSVVRYSFTGAVYAYLYFTTAAGGNVAWKRLINTGCRQIGIQRDVTDLVGWSWTSSSSGVATFNSGHRFMSDDLINLFGDGFYRYNMTCVVDGNDVTLSGGVGMSIPNPTDLAVMKMSVWLPRHMPTIGTNWDIDFGPDDFDLFQVLGEAPSEEQLEAYRNGVSLDDYSYATVSVRSVNPQEDPTGGELIIDTACNPLEYATPISYGCSDNGNDDEISVSISLGGGGGEYILKKMYSGSPATEGQTGYVIDFGDSPITMNVDGSDMTVQSINAVLSNWYRYGGWIWLGLLSGSRQGCWVNRPAIPNETGYTIGPAEGCFGTYYVGVRNSGICTPYPPPSDPPSQWDSSSASVSI